MSNVIFCNNSNELLGKAVVSDSVRSSYGLFPVAKAREGNGVIDLEGPYTGQADATLDIKIGSSAGSTPKVTRPVFSGIGNGSLTITGTDPTATAQEYTVKLIDAGTEDEYAQLPFYGVYLQARAAGAAGNGVSLSVDVSGLTFTKLTILEEPLVSGQAEYSGAFWDFGGLPLDADGRLSADSPRLSIGAEYPIFRQYLVYAEDGSSAYRFSPEPAFNAKAGTPVYTVTGTYSVTVEQGVTTETYPGLTTLYDLLSAISGQSELLTVVGVVADDRKPAGQSALDILARTTAYYLPIKTDGSEALGHLENISVADTVQTETVSIECVDNSIVGAELWSVSGSQSGALQQAVTDILYSDAGIGFRIPQKLPAVTVPQGDIFISGFTWIKREPEEGLPAICLHRPLLGGAATSKTLTLTWTARPADDCDCLSGSMTGGPTEECLGLPVEGGDILSVASGYLYYMGQIDEVIKDFALSNTAIGADGELRSAQYDLELGEMYRAKVEPAIYDAFHHADSVLNADEWQATTAVAKYESVFPTTANGYAYRANTAGTTGGSEPTWPTTIGSTVVDGGVTWQCIGETPEAICQDIVDQLSTDTAILGALGTEHDFSGVTERQSSTAVAKGDYLWYPTSDQPYESVGVVVKAGTTSDSVTVGVFAGKVLTTMSRGDVFDDGSALVMLLGKLHSISDDDINDVSATSAEAGISRAINDFLRRADAAAIYLRTSSGIRTPGKANAGAGGITSACWSDPGDAFYWAFDNGEYLPAFTGVYYHSVRRVYNPDTESFEIRPTHEFGFGLQIGCPERLKEGDKIQITIKDAVNSKTYIVGDKILLPIVNPSALETFGGSDGDDTQVWAVRGSVDGAFTDYSYSKASAPAEYTDAEVDFEVTHGTIGFSEGDQFSFQVGSKQYAYRYDDAAYSADADIPDLPADLGNGIDASFLGGAYPDYVGDDVYSWRIEQIYGPHQMTSPDLGYAFEWVGSSVEITADLGVSRSLEAIMIAMHTLPDGASITLSGGLAADDEWSESVDRVAGPIIKFIDQTARYVKVAISSAESAKIGWLWLGVPFTPSIHASDYSITRRYALARGAGNNPLSIYSGRGNGGVIAWSRDSGQWLEQADIDSLLGIIDHAQQNSEPVCLLPKKEHISDAALAFIDSDEVEMTDWLSFVNDQVGRLYNVSIPLRGLVE